MSEAVVTEVLGEWLSPSQANTYLTCPAKWYFRYLIGLIEPATGALALGKAFHHALARNFRQKMSTGCDMDAGELSAAFMEEWSLAIAEAELPDNEDATELAFTGQMLAGCEWPLPARHGDQDQDGSSGAAELSSGKRRPALCRDVVSHGAGLHPGRDLYTAPEQPPVFAPILRLLATLSA